MDTNNLGLVPVRNFGIVTDGVYRSAQPMYDYEYRWLRNVLELKHIINLRSESRHDELFAPKHGIEVHNFDVIDHSIPSHEQAEAFVTLVKQLRDKNEPFLFHCEHGHGRTSTFCCLAQVALGNSVAEALKDESDKYHYEFKHKKQLDFIQNFN